MIKDLLNFLPKCMATGIGSMPHEDPDRVCEVIVEYFQEAPFWPQMPRLSFRENMYTQYSEGCPGVIVKEEEEKIYVDTTDNFLTELEDFYRKYLDNDVNAFAISNHYARGLRMVIGLINNACQRNIQLIKGQVVGPISFGLTITDEKKRSIIYHELAVDAIIKLLAMKAKWLETIFHEALPETPTMIFFDEPFMVSYGSAFFNFNRSQIKKYLSECIEALSGMSGVHCCGNTDWSVITATGVNVISFDAYSYADSLALYPDEIKGFLDRGGMLAWGIIPTSDALKGETKESLVIKLEEAMQLMVSKGISKTTLLESAFITTSCGMGSIAVDSAERALRLTKEVSESMRKKHFDNS